MYQRLTLAGAFLPFSEEWLKDVNFNTTGVAFISANQTKSNSIYALNGQKLVEAPARGMYIEDGVKKVKYPDLQARNAPHGEEP